jgi:hypothetical protein
VKTKPGMCSAATGARIRSGKRCCLGRERKAIYRLIRGLNPEIPDSEYMQRAILMVAQMEGLMLFRLDKDKRRAEFLATCARRCARCC